MNFTSSELDFVKENEAYVPVADSEKRRIGSIEEMDSRYGRINYYISPKLLYEQTGYKWDGER